MKKIAFILTCVLLLTACLAGCGGKPENAIGKHHVEIHVDNYGVIAVELDGDSVLLPGAPDEVIDKLEAGIQRAGAVTAMLDNGLTPEDILGQVCGDLGVVFMETTEVAYKCYCDHQPWPGRIDTDP